MQRHDHPLFHDPAQASSPPLTPELVAAAEATLGRVLPAAYVEALGACNGGELRRKWLPTPFEMPRQQRGLAVRDLLGLGGEDGTDTVSAELIEEWGLPEDSVVLSSEGPQALLLDYRSAGEPSICWADTDREAEWTVAPCFEAFLAGIEFRKGRIELAVLGDLDCDAILTHLEAAGAEGPLRTDHQDAQILLLPGLTSGEAAPTVVRVRPNRRPEIRAFHYPELAQHPWLIETNAAAPAVEAWLASLEDTLPGGLLRLS